MPPPLSLYPHPLLDGVGGQIWEHPSAPAPLGAEEERDARPPHPRHRHAQASSGARAGGGHLSQVTLWNQADSTGRLVWCPRRALFTLLCFSGVLVLRSYRDPRTPSLQQLDHVPSLPTPPHGQWGSQRPHWVPRPEDVRDLSRRHGGAPGRCRVSCFRT